MKPLVVAIEMGYGHLRAALPLAERLETEVMHCDRPPIADPVEQRLWGQSRMTYELWCRVSTLPWVGGPLRGALDSLTFIPPLHPYRDLSAPNRSTRLVDSMGARGLGHTLAQQLRDSGRPLLATFFTPAVLADRAGCEKVHCVVTDSDINRVWAPLDAKRTKIHYFAPSDRVVRRLIAYGVPPDRVQLTGFPLPHELLGGRELKVLRKNLGRRLGRLDPTGRFRSRFSVELSQLGEPTDSDGKPPLITFAVGGAGAQAEMARQFLPGLKRLIENGKLRVCLVAGVRGEVAKEFREALALNHLQNVEILHEPTLDDYFRKFHERLADTDVLWTKPSEMTFFSALGLPLIMAPPVGVHERYNRRWAAEAGAGLFQHDVRFAGEWLEAYLADGTLAGAAWAGFRRLPQLGLYDIVDAVGGEIMKLSWATDIHLNFVSDEDVRKFRREVAGQMPKAVLLAGDIAEAETLEKYLLLLGGTLGVPIYFVLGNHDFYGGRIAKVRDAMRQMTRKDPGKWGWLPAVGVIPLSEKTALVGVDGWGDARIGNFNGSPVELNDWKQIDDLKFLDRPTRLAKLRALGDESADQLKKLLDEALKKFSRVVVLTHVPPFKETCWHEGNVSNDDWLPWFTCRAVGDVLSAAAERNPDKHIAVYCGHTHGAGAVTVRPNLVVHTGGAEYGKPTTQAVIEVD